MRLLKKFTRCIGLNDFYWKNFVPNEIIIPNFFEQNSEDAQLAAHIHKLVEQQKYKLAISKCQPLIANRSSKRNTAFYFWSQYAKWSAGIIKNQEFLKTFNFIQKKIGNHYFISYNRALVLIQMKQFEQAVTELNQARQLAPSFAGSETVLFWIYYFEQDSQYLNYYHKIKSYLSYDHRLLIEKMENIHHLVDSEIFKLPDTTQLEQDATHLFGLLPELIVPKAPVKSNTLFIAADSSYCWKCIPQYLFSKIALSEEHDDFGIHVHVYNPLGKDLEMLQNYEEHYPELNLSYSYEKASVHLNTEDPSYYASIRFCRAFQLSQQHSSAIKKIIITDADAILRKNPFLFFNSKKSVLLTYNLCAPRWETYSANFSSFSLDKQGCLALNYLSNALAKNFILRNEFWFIDQAALYLMYLNYGQETEQVSSSIVFGDELQHTEETPFWTYTNDAKNQDNLMNRASVALCDKYAKDFSFNKLIQGKYGLYVANKNDQFIGKSILNNGTWCEHEIKAMRILLSHGDSVVEVGSNIGSHTLALAQHVGASGRVYAFEPQRLCFQSLCANAALNSIENIFAYNMGCGEKEATMRIGELNPRKAQNFGGFQLEQSTGSTEVEVKPLDNCKIDRCRLIKLDVEGMELQVLKGAKNLIANCQPIIFFESHGDEAYLIQDYLTQFGYNIYDFNTPSDPMYLALTDNDNHFANILGLSKLAKRCVA